MANISLPKAFIFDLDGTLIDSVPDLTLGLNLALEAQQLKAVSENQVRDWVGNGSLALITRALAFHCNDSPSDIDNLHQAFLNGYRQVLNQKSVLYADVEVLLSNIFRLGIPMAIVTNKPIQFVPALLQAFNIQAYFSLVIGGDSLAEKKPSPMPLLHIASEWNIDAAHILMVGDSVSDIKAANAAHMPCILLRQGYHQNQDLAAFNPYLLLADIQQLNRMLFDNNAC